MIRKIGVWGKTPPGHPNRIVTGSLCEFVVWMTLFAAQRAYLAIRFSGFCASHSPESAISRRHLSLPGRIRSLTSRSGNISPMVFHRYLRTRSVAVDLARLAGPNQAKMLLRIVTPDSSERPCL